MSDSDTRDDYRPWIPVPELYAVYTPVLNLAKPDVGGDIDIWGDMLNRNFDILDSNAARNGGATPGPIPPSSPMTGQLWWDSDDGNLYVWYQDVDSAAWVPATAAAGGGAGAWPEAPNDGVIYGRGNLSWAPVLPIAGGTMTGDLILDHDPVLPLEATTRQYTDLRVLRSGDTMTGPLTIQNQIGFSRLALTVASAASRASLQFNIGGVAAWDFHMPGFGALINNLVLGRHNPTTGVLVENVLTLSNPGAGLGASVFNFIGSVMLDRAPTQNLQAATKLYVDNLATGAQQLIGAMDAATGQCVFDPLSGIPNGPLPPAAPVNSNEYVLVGNPGTPPVGPPETQVPLVIGDWLISDGNIWIHLAVGGAVALASTVNLNPLVFGVDNVQLGLEAAEAELANQLALIDGRVRVTGDTMIGDLTFANDIQKALAFQRADGTQRWIIDTGTPADDNFRIRANTNAGSLGDVVNINRQNWFSTFYGARVVAPGDFRFEKIQAHNISEVFFRGYYVGGGITADMRLNAGRYDEGQWEFWTENGGYSTGMGFRVMVDSPAGIYISGTSSATTHSNRSEAYLKEAITYDRQADFVAAFDALRPAMFKLKEQLPWPPVDSDGNLKAEPYDKPEQRDRFGFIVDDMAADPLLSLIVHQERLTQERGWDLGQVIALLVAKVQALEANLSSRA